MAAFFSISAEPLTSSRRPISVSKVPGETETILAFFSPNLAAFFLLLPVLTIPVSLLLLFVWGAALYFGSLLSGLLLAQLLLPLGKEFTTLRILGIFALMTLLLSFVKFIPFLGPLFAFVIFILTLGAFVLYKAKSFKVLRKAGMV